MVGFTIFDLFYFLQEHETRFCMDMVLILYRVNFFFCKSCLKLQFD